MKSFIGLVENYLINTKRIELRCFGNIKLNDNHQLHASSSRENKKRAVRRSARRKSWQLNLRTFTEIISTDPEVHARAQYPFIWIQSHHGPISTENSPNIQIELKFRMIFMSIEEASDRPHMLQSYIGTFQCSPGWGHCILLLAVLHEKPKYVFWRYSSSKEPYLRSCFVQTDREKNCILNIICSLKLPSPIEVDSSTLSGKLKWSGTIIIYLRYGQTDGQGSHETAIVGICTRT
ncbi:hypothetical protein WA026_008175 [Henosepilachna vigintioctopunctata]|uniref:Uncharacterized protein n=1 Tax=Henosepilachna vigintioctopunctata TaxID=420089 RepID=A0AAW1TPK1_9CUCU